MKPVVHQFEDKLLDFAYGELQPHEAEAVDAHVRGCTRCAEALSQINSVRSTMRSLPMEPAPAAGLESLLAFAEQHAKNNAKPKVQTPWWRRLILPLSSMMALLTVGVVAMRASYAPDPLSAAFTEKAPVPTAIAPATRAPEPEPVVADRAGAYGEEEAAPQLAYNASNEVAKAEEAQKESADALFRKQAPAKPSAKVAKSAPLEIDYSNSGVGRDRGAVKPTTLATKAPAENKKDMAANDGSSFGLQGGTVGAVGSAASTTASPKSGGSRYEDADRLQQQAEQKPVELSEKLANSPPPQAASAPVAAPLPEPSSMAMEGLSGGKRANKKLEVAEEREASVNDDEKRQAVRSRVTNVLEAQLAGARAASNRGDRQSEIAECLAVLSGGAEGYQRAESLKRLCDAYDALGQSDRAQGFCDLLVREFGQTAAAKQVVQRRSASQLREVKAKKMRAPTSMPADEMNAADKPEPQQAAPARK